MKVYFLFFCGVMELFLEVFRLCERFFVYQHVNLSKERWLFVCVTGQYF